MYNNLIASVAVHTGVSPFEIPNDRLAHRLQQANPMLQRVIYATRQMVIARYTTSMVHRDTLGCLPSHFVKYLLPAAAGHLFRLRATGQCCRVGRIAATTVRCSLRQDRYASVRFLMRNALCLEQFRQIF